jgi:type IV pilus assembly protein PilY1
MYEASFEPVNDDPLWIGHLKKYNINSDGTIGSKVWNAGGILQSTDASSRTMKTYKSGAFVSFTTANITAADLDVSTDAERNAIVGYIRGEAPYNPDDWKLGDVFHSNPVAIGTPSAYFHDSRDTNDAFSAFRTNHPRTSANGIRTIVAGANDGQLHAFRADTGAERWSFIPPNLLPKLKNLAHSFHPTTLTHQYLVDGPVVVSDVWQGSGDGTAKAHVDWKTFLIFGEGRGGRSTLWSSSSSCDSGFSSTYSTTYPYYGGYYCFDITNPVNPVYKWRINPDSSDAPYLGDPWCKIHMGRVKISGNEKWVGFASAGYNASDCSGGGSCDTRGKGFFVIDLSNGNILWSYTLADNTNMDYSIPATPSIVDTDNDGFIDTGYVGDLGGNMWRFKFCSAADGSTCSTSNWSGGLLFQSSSGVIRPIYTSAAVSKDKTGNLWIYWGTGDKVDPTDASAQEKFYAVKDNDRSTTWGISNLENITTGTYNPSSNDSGWYINLAGQGEKILAEPTVFGGVVYFTSFTPDQSGDPCTYGGDAKLYGVNYVTGGGKMTEEGDRSMDIGSGIATAPTISLKPGSGVSADLYVTTSGGPGGRTQRVNFNPPSLANKTNMLFWLDRRLQ